LWCPGIVGLAEPEALTMAEFLLSPPAQVVIWTAVLVAMIVVAIFFVQGCRRWQQDDRTSANELLTEFRNLRDSGNVSQAEFKNIRSVLGEKLQDELGSDKSDNSG
jgi:Mg2+/Co2+ transporter CorB